jgi:hypothetical protein
MKITDITKEFNFYIGNTIDGEDIVATNDGIEGDDGVIAEYDTERDINNADDLKELIDDALLECESFTQEDKDELGTYLGAEIDIDDWWEKNYE